jgi:purine nucleosidase
MNDKTVYLLLILFCTIFLAYSQDYVEISEIQRLKMLEKPPKGVSMVLDTDTYNEIDDQLALVYALLSKESFNLEAVYAAPFPYKRSENPTKGMELSYNEISRILGKMDVKSEGFAFKGSSRYLSKDLKPEPSAAIKDLI